MHCPYCGKYGSHHVRRTRAANYHWTDETVELFEEIAGRDLSY